MHEEGVLQKTLAGDAKTREHDSMAIFPDEIDSLTFKPISTLKTWQNRVSHLP